jgi:hypothetical protein
MIEVQNNKVAGRWNISHPGDLRRAIIDLHCAPTPNG